MPPKKLISALTTSNQEPTLSGPRKTAQRSKSAAVEFTKGKSAAICKLQVAKHFCKTSRNSLLATYNSFSWNNQNYSDWNNVFV